MRWIALLLLCAPHAAIAQAVLQEVPLMVEAPGFYRLVRGYHDGVRFYVDAPQFFGALGFRTATEGTSLVAMDARRTLEVDLAPELTHAGRQSVSLEQLEALFGADIIFDERRLSIRLSTAAESIDTGMLVRRPVLLGQVPGPLRFGRERQLAGGAVATYHVGRYQRSGQPARTQASVRFVADALGGSLHGEAGNAARLRYLLDIPLAHYVTHLEVGRLQGRGLSAPADAIRVSNYPLGSRHVQRAATFSGRSTPHARVEALVSGHVVDWAEADSEGRYRLQVPAYYGTTEAVVRHRPLGGAAGRIERHFFLATEELAEPRRLYYDAWLGQAARGMRLAYGLLPRLTVRAQGEEHSRGGRARLGGALSPLRSAVVTADVEPASGARRATIRLWRRHVSADASYLADPRQKTRRMHAYGSGHYRSLSGYAAVSATSLAGKWHARRFAQSATYYGRGGLVLEGEAALEQYGRPGALSASRLLRASAGGTGTLGPAAIRISVFALGRQRARQFGMDGHLTLRRMSFGMSASYDAHLGRWEARLSLRTDLRVAAISSRVGMQGGVLHHDHTAYGSIALGRMPRLSAQALAGSSAVLRIFADENHNGRLDGAERILPHVEAQLFHAGLSRTRSGALRASNLEPFTAYQVRILEATIRDPLLRPVPGYTFSFVADPGGTKILDIPLVRLPRVAGTVVAPDRAASRLRVRAIRSGAIVDRADVYRDGAFALSLTPGSYVLQLVDVVSGEALGKASLDVAPGSDRLAVTLTARSLP